MKYVGVDGCRGGWLAVGIDDDTFRLDVSPTFGAVPRLHTDAELILVDMPIGLLGQTTAKRACDTEARERLGARRNSVFWAPVRDALACSNHEEASRANRAASGRGLSIQAWGIVPKIRDLDEFLRGGGAAAPPVREMHPELCFWALSGGQPMAHPKKTPEGRAERQGLLESLESLTGLILRDARERFLRRDVGEDDVLDALVGAVTARSASGSLSTVPARPGRDEVGLPMEMVYRMA